MEEEENEEEEEERVSFSFTITIALLAVIGYYLTTGTLKEEVAQVSRWVNTAIVSK